jgi:hypothetical protein
MLELLIDSAVEAVELTNDVVLAQQTAYDETDPSQKARMANWTLHTTLPGGIAR